MNKEQFDGIINTNGALNNVFDQFDINNWYQSRWLHFFLNYNTFFLFELFFFSVTLNKSKSHIVPLNNYQVSTVCIHVNKCLRICQPAVTNFVFTLYELIMRTMVQICRSKYNDCSANYTWLVVGLVALFVLHKTCWW